MDTKFELAVKDVVIAGDGHGVDVDIHLSGDDIGHFVEQSDAVDAFHLYRSVKEELFVHVPFCIEDAVTETCLQTCCNRTGTFVYLNLFLVVDESKHIVAGNWVAAVHELVLSDIIVGDEYWLFAVKPVRDSDKLRGFLSLVLLLLGTFEEWNIFSPSASSVLLCLSVKFVDVFFSEYNRLFCYCLEEIVTPFYIVEGGELVGSIGCIFDVVIFEEVA